MSRVNTQKSGTVEIPFSFIFDLDFFSTRFFSNQNSISGQIEFYINPSRDDITVKSGHTVQLINPSNLGTENAYDLFRFTDRIRGHTLVYTDAVVLHYTLDSLVTEPTLHLSFWTRFVATDIRVSISLDYNPYLMGSFTFLPPGKCWNTSTIAVKTLNKGHV